MKDKEDKFWDISKYASGFRDYEGFASGDGLEDDIRKTIEQYRQWVDTEEFQAFGDVMLNFAYEVRDSTDEDIYQLWKQNIDDIAHVVNAIMGINRFRKSGIKW